MQLSKLIKMNSLVIIAYNGKVYPVWTQTNQFGRNIVMAKIDESALDVKELKIIATSSLYQNYPNPFNPTTKISYKISEKSFVSLKIYNLLGKEIIVLVNEEKPAGYYEKEFNAADLSSGIYFYKLSAGIYTDIKKMVLLK